QSSLGQEKRGCPLNTGCPLILDPSLLFRFTEQLRVDMSDVAHVAQAMLSGSETQVFQRLAFLAKRIVIETQIEMSVKQLLFSQFGWNIAGLCRGQHVGRLAFTQKEVVYLHERHAVVLTDLEHASSCLIDVLELGVAEEMPDCILNIVGEYLV